MGGMFLAMVAVVLLMVGTVAATVWMARQQDRAWQDYQRDLNRRGWTPTTVPERYKSAVVQRVRRSLPSLGPDWHPSHEESFRAAVEKKVLRKLRSGGDGSVMVRGQRVPPGLGFADFVLRLQVGATDQVNAVGYGRKDARHHLLAFGIL